MKSAPTPAANTGARLRPNGAQPRDARVDRDSMGDLADFISSTAPPGVLEQFPPRTTSTSASASAAHRGMNGTARNASSSTTDTRVSTVASLPPRRAESSAGRSSGGRTRLQARDAAVPRGDTISDLIDFVRSGPQVEKEIHRIPRNVAPFRSTMDSDQMTAAVGGGKAVDASLPDARYSQASTSLHSSINSQSALLLNAAKMNKPLQNQSSNMFDEEEEEEEDPMPKRKQRRVRDMYQIDFSDEEEEYEAYTRSRPKAVQEESLAEFLANVPPPPDSAPVPLFIATGKQGKIKNKTSSPSLMSRFGRKDSTGAPPKSSGNDSRSIRSVGSRPPQLPSHTPIAVQFTSNKPATYEPARGTGTDYVSQLDSARRVTPKQQYQAREAIYSNGRTNDLAAFLRDTPPGANSNQPQTFAPTLQKEEAGAFQRMFGRKKVH